MKEMLLITVLPMSIATTACSQFYEDKSPPRRSWSDMFSTELCCCDEEEYGEEDWWATKER